MGFIVFLVIGFLAFQYFDNKEQTYKTFADIQKAVEVNRGQNYESVHRYDVYGPQ
jgi:hypothetical protein